MTDRTPLSDAVDFNMAGHPDLYTFRYTGMTEDDVFKIRLQCAAETAVWVQPLAGIMVSHISVCTVATGEGGVVDATTNAGAADVAFAGEVAD